MYFVVFAKINALPNEKLPKTNCQCCHSERFKFCFRYGYFDDSATQRTYPRENIMRQSTVVMETLLIQATEQKSNRVLN